MTISLLAPGSAAYRKFITRAQNSYTSDANGVISGVVNGDVNDLINDGCVFLTVSPTGKNNLAATGAPATTDDSTADYAVGSLWINVSTAKTYRCVDATASAAVWVEMISAALAQTISGVKTFSAAPVLSVGASSADNITMTAAAKGLLLKQGANGKCGTFVANGATPVTVSNTSIAITDTIIISLNTVGGTVGVQPHVATITGSTGFTVVCTASDTSTYNYAIISNAA